MRHAAILAALAALVALAACGGDDTSSASSPSSSSSSTPSSAPLTVPSSCEPAPAADVELVADTLIGDAVELGEAFTADAGNGHRWLSANVYGADGTRLSSADHWVVGPDGEVYAVSSSAGDYSSAEVPADAAQLAGGEVPGELTDCIIAALRERNAGG